ncbi:DNA-binding protein [Streptomyces sp. NPDC101733]|uniref:DNA-binding protein n=1 Tax=unclassified Streptomyces TaxID=2593676 RepID=UPI0037FEB9B0
MTRPDPTAGRAPAVLTLARDAVERLVRLDVARGATAALPAVRETLRLIPELAADPDGLRPYGPDPLAALAELAEVAGWILFDAGRYRQARAMNARSLTLAGLCGDRWTARLTLLNHSMLTAHTGRARTALRVAARVAGPRPLPARVAGLVLIRQAHALALLGADREPLALMDRARGRFLDGLSRRDPRWAWWIDEAELLGHHGWVHARLRRWDRAVPLLQEAVTAPGPAYRHLFTAELLSALARAGAWREALDLITELAPRAAAIGSVRTTESLARTAARLRRSGAAPTSLRDAAQFLRESLPARAA